MAIPVDSVLLCSGKHCRRGQEDADRARRSLEGAARDGGARLVVVDCLSACDDAPVVALVHASQSTFFGRLSKEKHTLALCDVVAGRVGALPGRLEKRRLAPSGKSKKRATRALAE